MWSIKNKLSQFLYLKSWKYFATKGIECSEHKHTHTATYAHSSADRTTETVTEEFNLLNKYGKSFAMKIH